MTECQNCGGKLSAVIGMPSERRCVCYGCGMQYRVESWVEDIYGEEVSLDMPDSGMQCQS